MKKSDLNDKISSGLQGFSIDKAMNFVKKNVRYITAGVVMVVLVVVLVKCANPAANDGLQDGTEELTEVVEQETYEVDANPEINQLITDYYAAYAAGKVKVLRQYATPVTKNEASFIRMFAENVESYENIKCYTKPGLDDNSYLVSVYLEIKFKDVDTTAPGLDFFYVEINEDGELHINNRYSQFNLLNQEKALDASIKAMIDSFELEDDVLALQTEVQQKYEAALASDENLSTMVTGTIAEAYATWAQNITITQESTEQADTDQPASEVPASETEQPAAETPAEPETPAVSETVYTTDTVNIRAQANESAEVLAKVELGTTLTRTGTTDDGWSRIDYNGTEAYVKSDYVSTEAPQTETVADAIPEGTSIYLTQTVNVRASMSETADRVGTAFAGETVTVVMSYAEGWTKVDWNGQTGFIKTEFLQ